MVKAGVAAAIVLAALLACAGLYVLLLHLMDECSADCGGGFGVPEGMTFTVLSSEDNTTRLRLDSFRPDTLRYDDVRFELAGAEARWSVTRDGAPLPEHAAPRAGDVMLVEGPGETLRVVGAACNCVWQSLDLSGARSDSRS